MSERTKVVVVGGGLSGLAAAGFAARAGADVTVLEKAGTAGGRGGSTKRGGFTLNFGAHALYVGGPAQRALDDLGVAYSGGKPPAEGLALDHGVVRTLPSGFVSLLTTSLLSLAGKIELGKVLASVSSIDAAALMNESTSSWLARSFKDERARDVVAATLKLATYAADLERLSAGVAVSQLQLALANGVLYLDGGWETIVEGLRGAAEKAGARVRVGSKAGRVEISGGRVTGVRLDSGEFVVADAVILAGSPRVAAALCPSVTALDAMARAAVPIEATCVDLALSKLPRPRVRFVLGIDRPLYFSVHSASAKLAPEGGAVVHTIAYRSRGEDAKAAEHELDAMIDFLQPGAREHVVERRVLPAITVSHHMPLAAEGGYTGRPGARVPGCEGLFVAGDWVGPEGHLADAALASARAAASAAIEHDPEPKRAPRSHEGASLAS